MYQLHTEQIILELSTGQLAQVINPVWPGHPYLRLGGEKTEEVAVAVSAAAGRLCCCVLLCFFRKLWNQEVYFIQILWCVVGWNKKGQGWPRHLLIQNVKLVKVHQDSLKPKGERVSRNQLGLRKYLPFEAEMTAETEPKKSQLGSSPPCTRWDKTVWH